MGLYLGSDKKYKVIMNGAACKLIVHITKSNSTTSILGVAKLGAMRLGGK